jgi:hypothetical protein
MEEWNDLLIDRRSSPRTLGEEEFRAWMERQRIFVASCMDEELQPARDAIRSWLRAAGARPIMWEEITPQDRSARNAYLAGVEESTLFVLALGTRYGVTDSSGFSPTHREADRAKERAIPRLLFVKSDVVPSDRDGRLNDWLGSLRSEVSTGSFINTQDLCAAIEAQLRAMAAQQETPWIKLGRLVFPGRVSRRATRTGGEFRVHGRVRDPAVRHELARLGDSWSAAHADRLTWGHETSPVRVSEIELGGPTVSEDTVEAILTADENRQSGPFLMSYGSVGPPEQARLWTRRAVFGEVITPGSSFDMLHSATTPEGPTLPEVLANYDAHGWIAEGLTRLYLVEGLIRNYGGRFDRLEIGPATASAIRVSASFRLDDHFGSPVDIEGRVPIP